MSLQSNIADYPPGLDSLVKGVCENELPEFTPEGTWTGIGHSNRDVNSGLRHGARATCYADTDVNQHAYSNCDEHANVHSRADANLRADTYPNSDHSADSFATVAHCDTYSYYHTNSYADP